MLNVLNGETFEKILVELRKSQTIWPDLLAVYRCLVNKNFAAEMCSN
jgi:hypothetical protein